MSEMCEHRKDGLGEPEWESPSFLEEILRKFKENKELKERGLENVP